MRRSSLALLGCLVALGTTVGCAEAPPPATAVDVAPPRSPRAPDRAPSERPAEPQVPEAIPFSASQRAAALRDAAEFGRVAPDVDDRAVQGPGFRYRVPVLWEDLDPATLGSDLIQSSQRNTMPVDAFLTNVNVASEPFVGEGPAYADANLIELRKVATIREQRAARAGDRAAADIEAHWPNPGRVPYVTLQRYVTSGTEGFVITCSMAATAMERERPVCTRILDSFRVE